jgi:hypothetical protein
MSSNDADMVKLKELMESMAQSKENHFKKDSLPLVYLKALIFLGFQRDDAWKRIFRAMEDKKSETIEAQIKFLSKKTAHYMHRDAWIRLWFAVYGNYQVAPEDSAIVVHNKKQHHAQLPWMRSFMNQLESMQDENLNCQRDMLFCMAAMRDPEVNHALLGGVYQKLNADTTHKTLIESLMPLVASHTNDENVASIEQELARILPYLSVDFEACGLGAWSTDAHKRFYTVEPENYEKVTRVALRKEIEACLREQQNLVQTVDKQKLDVAAMMLVSPDKMMGQQQPAKKGELRQLLKRVREDIEILTNNQINEAEHYQQLQSRLKQRCNERKDLMERLNWEMIHNCENDTVKSLVRWTIPQGQGASLPSLSAMVEGIEQNIEQLQPYKIAQRSG